MILRRDLIALLAGVTLTRPLAAPAQQKAMPLLGYLSQRSPTDSASIVAAFREGLKEMGYVEGQNLGIVSRFAEGQIDRLPALATDLIEHGVNLFVATGRRLSPIETVFIFSYANIEAIQAKVTTERKDLERDAKGMLSDILKKGLIDKQFKRAYKIGIARIKAASAARKYRQQRD